MIAMASASLLPVPRPNRLNPPQPRPATLTLSPVRPSVVYSILLPGSLSFAPAYMGIQPLQAPRRATERPSLLPRSAEMGDPAAGSRRRGNAMRIDQAVNIEDLHRMAKRRLPKIAFDFIEGGLEDERGLETNTCALPKHQPLPPYRVDVS